MLTKEFIFSKIQELKPLLYKQYKVKKIGLFGSYADNNFNEDSDIDILIELEKPIGWKLFTLEILLEKTFGKKIDLLTKNAIKEQIKKNILNQVQYI